MVLAARRFLDPLLVYEAAVQAQSGHGDAARMGQAAALGPRFVAPAGSGR